jgi:hypothetical protein
MSTDRDSEVEVEGRMEGWNGNEDILEKVQDGTEKRKPDEDKRSHASRDFIGARSLCSHFLERVGVTIAGT